MTIQAALVATPYDMSAPATIKQIHLGSSKKIHTYIKVSATEDIYLGTFALVCKKGTLNEISKPFLFYEHVT